jgi:cytochrome c oxidase subunit 3
MLEIKKLSGAQRLEQRLRFHPVRVFTYLILAGISSAFVTLVFCYFATTAGSGWNRFTLPVVFHANTAIILFSSYAAHQMRVANQRDDQAGYKNALIVTSALGLVFTVFQFVGWFELRSSGLSFTRNISITYLYLISVLHVVHLLAGVGLLIWFLVRAYVVDADPYQTLIFETDPVNKLKVEMLGIYWHFVDLLWLFVYLSFVIAIYVVPSDWEGWLTHPF